ncbi:MAG: hypothetical protein GY866_23040 [Proteobacteria bacterium]|nr:hypothetical protein [Pseudomonadota bacterium]
MKKKLIAILCLLVIGFSSQALAADNASETVSDMDKGWFVGGSYHMMTASWTVNYKRDVCYYSSCYEEVEKLGSGSGSGSMMKVKGGKQITEDIRAYIEYSISGSAAGFPAMEAVLLNGGTLQRFGDKFGGFVDATMGTVSSTFETDDLSSGSYNFSMKTDKLTWIVVGMQFGANMQITDNIEAEAGLSVLVGLNEAETEYISPLNGQTYTLQVLMPTNISYYAGVNYKF